MSAVGSARTCAAVALAAQTLRLHGAAFGVLAAAATPPGVGVSLKRKADKDEAVCFYHSLAFASEQPKSRKPAPKRRKRIVSGR